MGVGQLSESDAVDALRLPFYSSSHPTGSHGWRNQFDLGNPDIDHPPLHEVMVNHIPGCDQTRCDRKGQQQTRRAGEITPQPFNHARRGTRKNKSEEGITV